MFSRAAKSVVKNLGHRKYYLNEDNIRSGIMGAADGLSQTLSPFGTGGSKFGGSTISNSKPTSHLLMLTTEQSQSRKLENPTTENRQTKCRRKNTALACFANRELDLERTITGLRTKDMNTSLESFPKKQSETSNQVGITNLPLYESKVNGRVTWVVSQLPGTKGNSESRWRQLAPSRSEGLPSYTPLSTQGWSAWPRNRSFHDGLGSSGQLRWSRSPSVIFVRGTTDTNLSATRPANPAVPQNPRRRQRRSEDSSLERRNIADETFFETTLISALPTNPKKYSRSTNDSPFSRPTNLVDATTINGPPESSRIDDSIVASFKDIQNLPIPRKNDLRTIVENLTVEITNVCHKFFETTKFAVFRASTMYDDWRTNLGKKFEPENLLRGWKIIDNFVVSSLKCCGNGNDGNERRNFFGNLFPQWKSTMTTNNQFTNYDKILFASLIKIRSLKNNIESVERIIERKLRNQ